LEDLNVLRAAIEGGLAYAVGLEEEGQILTGDGSGENLHGLIHQATAFNTALLGTGAYSQADVVARAIEQIELANEVDPTFICLDPSSYWRIRLAKSSTGEYIFGTPAEDVGAFPLFGLTAIKTNAISANSFLVGSSRPEAVAVFERQGLTIEISTEHADFWTRNMVAIRAEERIVLSVFRPGAFIQGSFSTSPA
jgi:HK97 family phage major capsid protein